MPVERNPFLQYPDRAPTDRIELANEYYPTSMPGIRLWQALQRELRLQARGEPDEIRIGLTEDKSAVQSLNVTFRSFLLYNHLRNETAYEYIRMAHDAEPKLEKLEAPHGWQTDLPDEVKARLDLYRWYRVEEQMEQLIKNHGSGRNGELSEASAILSRAKGIIQSAQEKNIEPMALDEIKNLIDQIVSEKLPYYLI